MSNLANYSPYNKTYKFLMFQNQAYHEKNKRTAKPCVRSNLRYPKTGNNSFTNPQNSNEILFSYQKPGTRSTQRCQSPSHSQARSMLLSSQGKRNNLGVRISEPKRVIHKHQSFQKFRQKKVDQDNGDMVSRLVATSCEVVKNKNSQRSYEKHKKYKNIRTKFDDEGKRKHVLAVGNERLLCPTLSEFNNSVIGEKFLELDMSIISKTSSPVNSPLLRGRKSNFSNQQVM